MPAITPVVTLRKLVLSRLKNACVIPSIYVGAIRPMVQNMLMENTLNMKKGKARYPIWMPVHLAQTGNCFPFQKKERSGFL